MKAMSFVSTKTNQGASAARVQRDSRFSRDQQRTKRKEKKPTSAKQNQTEEKVPPRGSFISYNEESDNEE